MQGAAQHTQQHAAGCWCLRPSQRPALRQHVSRTQRSQLVCTASGKVMLEVSGLTAKVTGSDKSILKGVNLTIREGESHAIMGQNGSGKSTLSRVLVGDPQYEVTGGSARFRGQDLFDLEPEERARLGLFLSFQSPIAIPGVSNIDFLRLAYNSRQKALGKPEVEPLQFYGHVMPKLEALHIDPSWLDRSVNEGFSGGERKRNEVLQLAVLEADLAILDEIDSGLDIDALRDVAGAVNGLKRDNTATLMVTHYKRLLDYIKPTQVHVMKAGQIILSGGIEVADILESDGYEGITRLLKKQPAPQTA